MNNGTVVGYRVYRDDGPSTAIDLLTPDTTCGRELIPCKGGGMHMEEVVPTHLL